MDDLDRLVHDLEGVTSKAHIGIAAATKATAERSAMQARKNAAGAKHLPKLPAKISSEVDVSTFEIRGTVGIDKGGQGSLGHIYEYGSPTSGAHMPVNQAVDAEMDGYVDALAKLAGGLL